MMQNPWTALKQTQTSDYVLLQDKELIDQHNSNCKDPAFKVHLDQLPEPFIGRIDAPVVLLGLNPGYDATQTELFNPNEPLREATLRNLYHQEPFDEDFYFYMINDKLNSYKGYDWWKGKLKSLIKETSLKYVAKNVLCVEYFPYHSEKFGFKYTVKSQEYNFDLVKAAMNRKALIVIMRSVDRWFDTITDLKGYPNKCALINPQTVTISAGNFKDANPKNEERSEELFKEVVTAVLAES